MPIGRQPEVLDYASPTQFRMAINQLPKVEFFITACNLPGINLGEAVFPTPLKQIPIQGDELTFENLSVSFLVDENLQNYKELHDWLIGIGFPQSRQQFKNFRSQTANRPGATRGNSQDIGDVQPATPISPMFSDGTLTILSNKNNPVVEVRFEELSPVALGALSFDQEATDVQYLKATADFNYKYYEIVPLT
tara:strand:- start:8639 stop:9217 length:579 start_codon:yes stop_codon:yes gene_type:complete